jgi:hypothetical protein
MFRGRGGDVELVVGGYLLRVEEPGELGERADSCASARQGEHSTFSLIHQ